jgi:peptidoglycan/LPS O-acetylase OafA/YrhL
MDSTPLRIIGAGLGFILIFLSGFRLKRADKPYRTIPLNFHKLIGLATGILLAVTVYQVQRAAPHTPVDSAALLVTGLFFVSMIISGGLVSIDKPMPAIISRVHRLFPYLTALSSGITLYLLLS